MYPKQLTHRMLIRYDERIGHAFVPNLTMRMPYSEKPYYIRTNAQGFRSNFNYEKRKSKEEKRMVFIGDSHTAGDGVANEKRFSDLVGQKFDVSVYNFGLSGSGVDQQYLIYKDIVSQYDHDYLIISPHIIDISRNILTSREALESQTGKKFLVPKPYFKLENGELFLKNVPVPKNREAAPHTNGEQKPSHTDQLRKDFHKFPAGLLKDKALRLYYHQTHYKGYNNENSYDWQLMMKLLESIIEIGGNKRIFLAPIPDYRIRLNPDFRSRFLDLVNQFDNVSFIDILDKYKHIENTDLLHSTKDAHCTEYGHQVIADAIIEEINKDGLIVPKIVGRSKVTHKHNKPEYILGISAFYHDSASTLIKNGRIVAAAQEERFTRRKNDPNFPYKAINYCLEQEELDMKDIDAVVFYDNPYLTLERIITSQLSAFPDGMEIWKELFPRWIQTKMHIPEIIHKELNYKGDIFFAKHHLSHASSAFYPSPFNEAAILTIDGVGEWATATIGYGKENKIKILKQMDYPNSVGLLYSAFTFYCGFKVNEGEYKLMGLAPYGEPKYVDIITDNIVKINEDGSIHLNMKYFGFKNKLCMINEEFEVLFGGPPRNPDDKISQRIRDIARSIQVVTEEIIIKMAQYAREITKSDYLCLAGGVALNCVANGKLLKTNIFKDIWIQPAAGDAGCSLGAALALYYDKDDANRILKKGDCIQKGSYWGPSFSSDEVKAYLESHGFVYKKVSNKERNKLVAKYINDGKIVGHFSGRMEFGPRALGARSILGDARNEKAQSILNLKIKFRESFRPFAPTVLEEDISDYFDLDRPSPYMLLVADVNNDIRNDLGNSQETDIIQIVNQRRSDLPAITHVDYTARVQSVNKEYHKDYYEAINEFKQLTGYGTIINTSFNVNKEPIICTPKDAVKCFMSTDMDVLIIEDHILIKEEQEDKADMKFIPPKSIKQDSELIKIQKNAEAIFNKYFVKLNKIAELKSKITNRDSTTWIAYKDGNYFDKLSDINRVQVQNILDNWNVTPEENKNEFIPVLQKIIDLSKKYQQENHEVEAGLSEAIYMMF